MNVHLSDIIIPMKLFVFDLDFTLWNAGDTWCDATAPPYKWNNGKLLDQYGRWVRLYEDVHGILQYLKNDNRLIAAASRTGAPVWANELLHLLDVDQYFNVKEIYPGNKFVHLRTIMDKCKVHRDEIVFFDDEYRNIRDINSMGITSIFVENGITWKHIKPFL